MSLAIASTPTPCILTDDIYDRDRASDGISRFGAYVAMRLPAIVDDDPDVLSDPVRWASFAWATAAPPVMSPGYVDWNDPIEDVQVGWDDRRLVAEIVVRTGCPANLTGWRSWERDLRGNLVEPWHGNRIALSRTTLRAVLREVALPGPRQGSRIEWKLPGQRRSPSEQSLQRFNRSSNQFSSAWRRVWRWLIDEPSWWCVQAKRERRLCNWNGRPDWDRTRRTSCLTARSSIASKR